MITEFLNGYVAAALWSSIDEFGEPLDAVFSADDIAPACMDAMRASCLDFIASNSADINLYLGVMSDGVHPSELQAGRDFWLTRNRHGAGFWDRGLGAIGERLSDAARIYGSVDLYVGDDGLIYGETQ